VVVTGSDIYGLDADHNGIGCQSTEAPTRLGPRAKPAPAPAPTPASGPDAHSVGHGLSHITFDYRDMRVHGGETTTISFTVSNTGQRRGAEAPQLYLTDRPDGRCMRQLGVERVELEPGTSRTVTLTVDLRLLAHFDTDSGRWELAAGTYQIALATPPPPQPVVLLVARGWSGTGGMGAGTV
jgi:hypothetical protein